MYQLANCLNTKQQNNGHKLTQHNNKHLNNTKTPRRIGAVRAHEPLLPVRLALALQVDQEGGLK